MSSLAEKSYFEGFSGHQPTDDSYWDLWLIMWSGDSFCASEHKSREAAEIEMVRLRAIDPDTNFTITRVPNAGYCDMRLIGGWRMFGRDIWRK